MDVPENLTEASPSERAIATQWDELTRLAASIEAGIVTADVALARFASVANAGTPLHRAADQLGRLLRTVFLCGYLTDEAFRREMHRLLGHGESVHTLQRAIFFGQLPVHRGRRQEEAIAVSGSLTLLTNVVIAWTACRIQETLVGRGVVDVLAPEQDRLRHVGPARSENVNFRGTYTFPSRRRGRCPAKRAAASGEGSSCRRSSTRRTPSLAPATVDRARRTADVPRPHGARVRRARSRGHSGPYCTFSAVRANMTDIGIHVELGFQPDSVSLGVLSLVLPKRTAASTPPLTDLSTGMVCRVALNHLTDLFFETERRSTRETEHETERAESTAQVLRHGHSAIERVPFSG